MEIYSEGMGMTIFWVDNDGTFVKATDDSQTIKDLNKVTTAPQSGKQTWDGSKWSDYTKPKTYVPSEFFDLFTKDEWKAIKAASKMNDDVEYWMDKLRVVQSVDVTDKGTIEGVNQMVSAGLLTQARADDILS